MQIVDTLTRSFVNVSKCPWQYETYLQENRPLSATMFTDAPWSEFNPVERLIATRDKPSIFRIGISHSEFMSVADKLTTRTK